MRRLLQLLTVFDWVSPTVGLVDDVVNPGADFVMDSENYDKAVDTLQGQYSFSGGHLGGGGSSWYIKVDQKDERDVKRILGRAGVTRK